MTNRPTATTGRPREEPEEYAPATAPPRRLSAPGHRRGRRQVVHPLDRLQHRPHTGAHHHRAATVAPLPILQWGEGQGEGRPHTPPSEFAAAPHPDPLPASGERERRRMYQFTVDFIIVGAGSAGAALANRLSENGRHQVLLLEAGGETHPLSRVPVSFARFINRPGVNWLYAAEPEANTGGRPIPVPRGRMLGGSSAINGMVWVRGQRQDYDHWAQLGNRGWSYQDVLPIFKEHGELRRRRRRDARPRRPAQDLRHRRERPPLRQLLRGRRDRRHQAQPRLQRCRSGRHRHDAGLDQQRPAHEHGALLSRPRAHAPEPHHRDQAHWPRASSSRATGASACATPCTARSAKPARPAR